MPTALLQTLCAVFCAILAHPSEMGGGSMTSAGHHIMFKGAAKVTPATYTGIGQLVRLTYGDNSLYPELTDGVLDLYNQRTRFGRGYATLPFTTPAWNRAFDVVVCVDWKDKFNYFGIMGNTGNVDGFTPFWYNMDTSIQFCSYLHNVGWPVRWDNNSQKAAGRPSANSRTFLRLTFDGNNTYKFYTSNGAAWVNTNVKTSSATVQGGDTLQIGSNRGSDASLNALVDLNYCYIRYDGGLLWEGTPGAYDRVINLIGA